MSMFLFVTRAKYMDLRS